ncbi:hypothetical protein [Actinophytocola sp. KF-1]
MSEEDVRVGLLDAVADEPPLLVDPDELIAAARGQVRRRALVAVGFATVAVAVAAVAVPAAVSRDAAFPAATQPPAPSAQPARYSVDHLRARAGELREHLRGTLPVLLPSAARIVVGEFGGEAEGAIHPRQTSLNTVVTVTIKGARYSIMVTTWVPGTAAPPSEVCAVNCHRMADQAGGAVYQQTDDLGKAVIETVFHYRDTGAAVSVAAYNYDMTSPVPSAYHRSLPVTRAQLVALATDPALAL